MGLGSSSNYIPWDSALVFLRRDLTSYHARAFDSSLTVLLVMQMLCEFLDWYARFVRSFVCYAATAALSLPRKIKARRDEARLLLSLSR
jgi:hypothetical protein